MCCSPGAYFYPRPPRGGRRLLTRLPVLLRTISIHALREEGDSGCSPSLTARTYFYPRPPRGGRLGAGKIASTGSKISIHALREEGDCRQRPSWTSGWDFYPRPPRGGRHLVTRVKVVGQEFLSTPSARRATLDCSTLEQMLLRFLSTPSARRATKRIKKEYQESVISIHALREEDDHTERGPDQMPANFYPRPPRGGRPSTLA